MATNPELPENVYGGSMTPDEFMRAEFNVDGELPPMESNPLPVIELTRNGSKAYEITPANSSVIRYGEEWNMFDHVLLMMRGKNCMFFYNVYENYLRIAEEMINQDFPLLHHYSEPTPEVKEELYGRMRGTENITSIIGKIIDAE